MEDKQKGRRSKQKSSSKNGKKILIIAIIVIILIAGGALAAKIIIDKNKVGNENAGTENQGTAETKPEKPPEPVINIFNGDARPIAVMIDNNTNAWPHAGLDKAYMVYEIIVEGGETRLMALFKGQDIDKIGPIRSSRPYFLDYALENDAIYTHFGWSPQARSDISTLNVDNISGQSYDSGRARTDSAKFWREAGRYAPHNAMTSTDALNNIAKDLKYATTSNKESVLNYVADEVNLEEGEDATEITIPYNGSYNIISYEYDEENKVYIRYSKGDKQVDAITKEALTVKNIIITFANNESADQGKGRQALDNIGKLDGYYITNGKAIKITCEKESRKAQTVYKDLEGNEIQVNDGNTYVQICPLDAKVTIE